MYVQSCANHRICTAKYVNFRNNERRESYFTYMANRSDNIVQTSVIAGSLIGTFSARKNITGELVPKVFMNIGIITMGLFGFFSLKYLIPGKEEDV
jgi:hypothetical protein